ncbi:MAG: phospholipase [Nitrospirae bacterium]|nr:phospholipase [Nitrospirota bacterium]
MHPSFGLRIMPFLLLILLGSSPGWAAEPAAPLSASPEIQILPDRDYAKVLFPKLGEAKTEILISIYLFKTDDSRSNPTNKIEKLLEKAAKRGVTVKVLMERESDADSILTRSNEETAERLAAHGIRVIFDSPKRRTHTKALVIDRRYVFIGSHNFTRSALRQNREVSVLIDHRPTAEKTAAYIESLIRESEKKGGAFPAPKR